MKLSDINEGYWKNIDIEQQDSKRPVPMPPAQKYNVLVNGKVWCRNGIPIEFNDIQSASKSADTIKNRYNKVTQVKPVKPVK